MARRGGWLPLLVLVLPLVVLVLPLPVGAGDWPHWLGADRDGSSDETGLLAPWPEAGPPVRWRRPSGGGFSGVAVDGERLYTMWSTGGEEHLVCLDANSGDELWQASLGPTFRNERGGGPRSFPTLDGDLVYALSGLGRLQAHSADKGELRWAKDLVAEFGARVPIWGVSTSPLVAGRLLVVAAGGDGGKAVIAFDKRTGEVVWSALSDPPSYSSPIALGAAGAQQLVFVLGQRVVSLSPAGDLLWSHPWPVVNNINVATPVAVGDDRVFVSTSYDVGGVLLRIEKRGDELGVSEVWKSRVLKNHFHTSVLHGGHLYGFDNATLKCVEAATGEERWRRRGLGKGSLILADGRLVVLGERGRLVLVDASAEAYAEAGATQALQGRCWTAPTLAGGRLYLRNEEELVSLALKPEGR